MKPLPVIKNCDDCGACCTGQAALPVSWYTSTAVLLDGSSSLPPELLAELEAMRIRFLADGFPPDDSACVWYDVETRRCRHYEHRPDICRDEVQPGDDSCRNWRRSVGIDPAPKYSIKKGRLKKELR